MENWGLVSFREDRIIFDEKIASTGQKQRLAETMAHEIAHFCTYFPINPTREYRAFL
jgi:aminopeptidase N